MTKATLRHGTAKDDAEKSPGYVSSGEGEWSRKAAHQDEVKLSNSVTKTKGKHSLARLIAENKSQLRKMRCDLLIEDSKERLAKIRKNIETKTNFIERLEVEQRDSQITTLPGENDILAWENVK